MRLIEHSIYSILDDVINISFEKVDEIALKGNIALNDENRIKACIIYMMKLMIYKNGDTYLEKETIRSLVDRYLKQDISSLEYDEYFEELIDENKIVIENDNYYLTDLYNDENYIVKRIHQLIDNERNVKIYKKLIFLMGVRQN